MKLSSALSLVLLASVTTPAQARSDNADSAAAGVKFVRLLAAGKYAEAAEMFDETMTELVSMEKLEASWKQQAGLLGAFVGLGEPTVTPYQQYKLVFVPCVWEKGRLRVQVTLDAKKRVAGYFFRPPGPESKPVKPAYLSVEGIDEREVTVGSKPWILPGTLTLPKSGPVRAGMVFVHGSGPNDRDETLYSNKPFRDLAWGLGRHGIATLRYDKRTKAHGAKMAGLKVTAKEEVIDDALLALDVLRQQAEVKGVPVYLLGHSLGAMLAPAIAAADGKVAGVILLAGTARPFGDVLVEQFTYLVWLDPGEEGLRQLATIKKQVSKLRKRTLGPDDSILGVGRAYWYDLCDRDAEAALETAASLTCRILVLQGGRDYQVTMEDFELWRAALAGHSDATFKSFDNLNHLFAAGEGKGTPMEYIDQKYVDPRVIDLIAKWATK